MKTKILPGIFIVILFSSCSSLYRSGQTPDDVYYSPAREITYREETTRKEEERVIRESDVASIDDQYLRMKIRNRRWSSLDDFDYWNDSRYYHGHNCNCNGTLNYVYLDGRYYPVRTWNNPYNVYSSINNPYYPVVYYKDPRYNGGGSVKVTPPKVNTGRPLLSGYKNDNYNNTNSTTSNRNGSYKITFPQNNSNRNYSNNNSNNSYQRTDRTYTPPATTNSSNNSSSNSNNSSGSSSSSSSSSSGTVTRPPRGSN